MQVRVGIKELNPDKACYLLPIRLPIHRINQKRRKLGPAERRTGYTSPTLVVRRKTARRNLNKQRAARRYDMPVNGKKKRKLAQKPKQPKISQFQKSTKNLL
jgi:hypothetical protein